MLWKLLRERSRTRAVDRLGLIGAPAEPGLNRFTERAAQAFAAPMSLLTLLRDEQLWVKAGTGFEMECMPREDSFCNRAVDRTDLLEVCDAASDRAFRALPPVTGAPHIRYYIGAPLTLESGIDVGALCVFDTEARRPASRDQRACLIALARQATDAIERYADLKRLVAA